MLKTFAQIVGVILLVLGVAGLLLGDQSLNGMLNIDLVQDLIRIVTGALLLAVGFGRVGAGQARSIVGGVGILYLVLAVLGFLSPNLFGLLPSGYTEVDNVLHLVLGVAGIVIGYGAPSARTGWRRGRSRRY